MLYVVRVYQLVGDVSMVSASHALTNGRFHQSRQRRQYIDGRIDLVMGVGKGKGSGARVSIAHTRWVCMLACLLCSCLST